MELLGFCGGAVGGAVGGGGDVGSGASTARYEFFVSLCVKVWKLGWYFDVVVVNMGLMMVFVFVMSGVSVDL